MADQTNDLTTIEKNWHHYAERDIPMAAPWVQRNAMKSAFYSGAASVLMLAVKAAQALAIGDKTPIMALSAELKAFEDQRKAERDG